MPSLCITLALMFVLSVVEGTAVGPHRACLWSSLVGLHLEGNSGD